MAKLTIKLKQVEVTGITLQEMLSRMAQMKQALEALGCEVSINLDGDEIDEILATDQAQPVEVQS